MITLVATDSQSGERSAANHHSASSRMMPMPWESWRKPRIECLNRMVPTRNTSGPPIVLTMVLTSEWPVGCFSTSSSTTAVRMMPATIGMCR